MPFAVTLPPAFYDTTRMLCMREGQKWYVITLAEDKSLNVQRTGDKHQTVKGNTLINQVASQSCSPSRTIALTN
jgi:hypothetical protein